ncbi:RagB/SusD family nutrient uptake outer membrane protein [Parapedobacter sp. 10938]|uniref:RagB/SusD family nutrient uptake outer membrane protein n=1 Tax=Parapedobacter flavus TaxID=3110225 RepID=UPI002DBAEC6D|nr:RagB/SusD family nutrient uptake outer membrane protein [Parapedobacter sp. 10938]MEC3881484.1 RagB/SusD family nutrient uptake outer membrane protein [Parapedobacter sp. 10938]
MINHIFKIKKTLALVALILLGGCSDVLDQAPDGKIALADVFKDDEKTAAYLNSCYAYIPGEGKAYFFHMRGPVDWSDESWDTDAEAEPWITSGQLYSGNVSAAAHFNTQWADGGNGNYWVRMWEGIRKCSVFLDNIDAAKVKSETNRARWKAEAHLLRAYYYMVLLKFFGCPLPVIRAAHGYEDDFSETVRSSYYDVVQFIIEDCDAALSTAELPWRITTNAEAFRLTKAVAEGIKSRMTVYAASPLYNEGNDYWDEAYQVNKAALDNLKKNGYELYDQVNFASWSDNPDVFLPNDAAKLFNEYFCNSMAYESNPTDKETIYQTNVGQDGFGTEGVGAQGGYKSGSCPSQEIVDCFETIDGQPILNLAKPYNDEVTHLQPNFNAANTLYDEQDPYENRDPRFYASIYYNGSQRKCYWPFDETSESIENYPAGRGYRTRVIATWEGEPQTGIHPTIRKATRTGYFLRKFLHPNTGQEVVNVGMARPKVMRLGEIYLNFAEAAAESDHLSEAYEAVNTIRRRVNMPDLPEGLSKDQLLLRIRNERRVELAFEAHRYFDVRRWHTPNEDLEKTDRWITAAHITRNDDGTYTYARGPVSRERLSYTNKFLWFPIPLDDANIMIGLTGENWQNPGW